MSTSDNLKESEPKSEDLLQIKPVGKMDMRSITSKKNALKTGRYAKDGAIPLLCNDCYLRPIEKQGNGKCSFFKEGAVCCIDDKLKGICEQYDTRNPEDIKEILDELAHIYMLRVLKANWLATKDGGFVDKATDAQTKQLLNIIVLINDLSRKVVISAEETRSFRGGLSEMFRKVNVTQFGSGDSGGK